MSKLNTQTEAEKPAQPIATDSLFKIVDETDIFRVTDRVRSGENYGWITKITDLAIHVKWENGDYQKFFWLPKHHMQSPISDLKPCH